MREKKGELCKNLCGGKIYASTVMMSIKLEKGLEARLVHGCAKEAWIGASVCWPTVLQTKAQVSVLYEQLMLGLIAQSL